MHSSPGPGKPHVLQGDQACAPQLTLQGEVHPGKLEKARV